MKRILKHILGGLVALLFAFGITSFVALMAISGTDMTYWYAMGQIGLILLIAAVMVALTHLVLRFVDWCFKD